MQTGQLLLFVAAGLLLNLTPGPDVLFIVSSALRQGRRSGCVAALGISAGCFVHIVAAALGLSALMTASATAFSLLKWLGAAYLFYLGASLLLARSSLALPPAGTPSPVTPDALLWPVFIRGFWTNALNPKVALFFLAFVPQFIGSDVQDKALAFFLLGLLFNINALWVNLGWALAAAWLVTRLGRSGSALVWFDRLSGSLFMLFGLRLAMTDATPHS
jgi:threonine/homoserine/homoserine lactone efflux protein